jgi:hypothetical protein
MPTYPDAITNPLAPPTVSGTTVTVDFLLQNPTRVTRTVADLVMANFFLDQIFATGGDVSGGAVLYDRVDATDAYTAQDVERVEAGTEYPIVGGVRFAPRTAQVEKFGGKFPITDEARRRNNITRINNQMRRLANTITRKMHQRGLAEIAAAVTEHSRTATGVSWKSAMALTGTTTAPSLRPARDFAAVQRIAEVDEMGYDFDTLIVYPTDAESLRVVYADDLDNVLADNGISTFISTPRKAAGSAYFCSGGMVGEMRVEEPMNTVTEREGAPQLRDQTWVQTGVRPVMYVTDPFAILEVTGIAA